MALAGLRGFLFALLMTTVQTFSAGLGQRVIVITGATDGIGRHTAKKLAADGHALILHGRNEAKGMALREELQAHGAAEVHYVNANLASLDEVRALGASIQALTSKVDVLINNAGVFDPTPQASLDGYDATWAINVLAPFVLTRSLLPLLGKGDAPRIITTSSISQSSRIDLAKVQSVIKSAHEAYSLSKLGDMMFTAGLAKRLDASTKYQSQGIRCVTMDPGTVNTKMLLAGWGAIGIPVDRADRTYDLAVTDTALEGPNGGYFFGGTGSADGRDTAKIDELWAVLEDQTGVTYADLDT